MANGFQLGRLFRTDIYAAPNFLLLLGLIAFVTVRQGQPLSVAAVWLVVLVVSILVHEFGHVFAVRRLLGEDSVVILWGLGGLTVHRGTSDRAKRIGISLAGPAFGLVLGGLAVLASALWTTRGMLGDYLVAALVWVNVVWTGVNLLPVHPLDGGQALAALLEYFTTPARSRAVVRLTSVVCCLAGGFLAIQAGWVFAAVLAGLLLLQNLAGGRPGL